MRARLFSAVLIFASFPAFAAITGTVINPDGQAVAGAKVSSFALESVEARRTRVLSADPARKPLATTQTDSKGNFSIDAPKASVVDLRFEATGLAPQVERAAADDDAGVIQLSPAQMKQGTIIANGKPLANASVLVAGDYGEIFSTTDATGHYSLPDPAHFNSRIFVRHPDYALANQPVGRFSSKTDIALDPGTSLSGRVVAEDGQTPVANAIVMIDEYPVTKSADDGTFSIAHLPKKFDQIEVHIDNRLATRAYAKELTSPLLLKLARGASLTGTVRDSKTQLPVAGAEVRLIAPRSITIGGGMTAISDAKGNYAIAGMTGGDFDVLTSRPNYGIVNMTVHLGAGQTTQKALYGTPLGRISGTVVDENKRGITAAHIEPRQVSNEPGMMTRMRMMDRGHPTLTAPDGRFVIRVENESDLQLEAVKKGLPSGRSATLKVGPGESKSGVVITLPHGVAVTGRVIDSKGKPIAGVAVGVSETRNGGGGPGNVRRMIINNIMRGNDDDNVVRTGTDGTFSMRVKEGTYDVGFRREGFAGKSLRAQQVSASSKPLEVTLEPGVEISGRVTRGGQPVEGVNVIPIGTADQMMPVQTGPDGTFRIGDLTPGEMMVAFSKREEFIQMNRAVNAPANDVNIELPAGGRLSGRVVDKNTHDPVKAFEAGISPSRNGGGMVMMMAPSMKSFTSDDGTFVLENVPVGALTLAVSAPGYVQTRVPNITLESGKAVENIEVAMETGVRVTGHVTGPDGSPASGAMVRIDPMAGGRAMRGGGMNDPYTTVDPNGEYTLENVEPGEKTLVFSRSGLISTSKTVTLSGDHQQVDAQLTSGVRTTGIVLNEGGTPVADASVRAQSAADPGFGRGVRTDAGGTFSFDGLAPGHYEFIAQKDGYADAIMRDVDITTAGMVRLTLTSGGTITGHLSGLTDAELQNASVFANSPNGNATAPVDSNGNYRIDGAPTGTVRVNARAGQMMTSSRSAPAKSVQVNAGSAVTVDFDFTGDNSVKGRVTRNGAPVAGAMVMFNGVGRNDRVSTDSGGRYEVTGLDKGKYNVTVMDPNRGPYSTSYTVSGSDTFDIDMRGTPLRGHVIDTASGAPVQDAMVTIRRTDPSVAGIPVSATSTDAGGNFSFDSVPAGSYKATAEKSDYGAGTSDVTVTDNGADAIELQLTPTPGILLKVVDARDQRPISASYHAVSVSNPEEVHDDFIRMMASSTEPMKITLTPGQWKVTVGAQNYASQTFTLTSPGAQTVGLTPGGTIVVSSTTAGGTHGRLLDSTGTLYPVRGRNPYGFPIEVDPLQSTFPNIAPGIYTLQLLDDKNAVLKSTTVTVVDGGTVSLKL